MLINDKFLKSILSKYVYIYNEIKEKIVLSFKYFFQKPESYSQIQRGNFTVFLFIFVRKRAETGRYSYTGIERHFSAFCKNSILSEKSKLVFSTEFSDES